MLKIMQNTNNITENLLSDAKCAEIHYFTEIFNIICLKCKQLFYEYQDFVEHFQKQHLYEFILNLKNADKSLIEEKEMKNKHTELALKEDINRLHTDNLAATLEENIETSFLNNNLSEEESSDFEWSNSHVPELLEITEKRTYKSRNASKCCTYCGKTFRRRYQLDTHVNIHTGLKPHQCEICGRQFRAFSTLQRHLNTHEKHQLFVCKFCYKEFTHRAALVSHETRHTQKRNIHCDDCNKLFYTQNQLDTHKRKLHNKVDDLNLPYACDICPKRYRSASMLSTHKFKKHYKMAKYQCEQCDKKFVEQTQLDKHKSIHFKKI